MINGVAYGHLFLWLAYSQHVGVVGYTGLRSFHEFHPVLSCGALTGLSCRQPFSAAPSGLDYGSVRYRGLRSQGSLHPWLFCVTASRFFVVAIDGNPSGSLFSFCIYTGSVASLPLACAVGWVAFSHLRLLCSFHPKLFYAAPLGEPRCGRDF